jgi:hypothetical protein
MTMIALDPQASTRTDFAGTNAPEIGSIERGSLHHPLGPKSRLVCSWHRTPDGRLVCGWRHAEVDELGQLNAWHRHLSPGEGLAEPSRSPKQAMAIGRWAAATLLLFGAGLATLACFMA